MLFCVFQQTKKSPFNFLINILKLLIDICLFTNIQWDILNAIGNDLRKSTIIYCSKLKEKSICSSFFKCKLFVLLYLRDHDFMKHKEKKHLKYFTKK